MYSKILLWDYRYSMTDDEIVFKILLYLDLPLWITIKVIKE